MSTIAVLIFFGTLIPAAVYLEKHQIDELEGKRLYVCCAKAFAIWVLCSVVVWIPLLKLI